MLINVNINNDVLLLLITEVVPFKNIHIISLYVLI